MKKVGLHVTFVISTAVCLPKKTMEKEIWRPIKGYEGWYEVSSYGNVRSVDRMETLSNGVKRLRKGRIMKLRKDKYGYLQIQLWKNSKCKAFTVHRLVAEAFIHNPNNLPEVNHKDEDKTNNCVENLEWCTQSYNINYGTRNEKVSKPVLQIDLETNQIISKYPSANEAARQLNINQGGISGCCNGKYKTYKGFKWRYKE